MTRTLCQGLSQTPLYQRSSDGLPPEESSESHTASGLSDATMEHAFWLLLPESSLCRKNLSHPPMGENSPQGESFRTTTNLATSTQVPERPVDRLSLWIVCLPGLPHLRLGSDNVERDFSETPTVTHIATDSG